VRPGEGNAHVRIRAAMPEDAAERHVMDAFAHPDRRLLFVGEQAGTPVVEVAHEALVRGWDTLRGWVEDNRDKLRGRDAVSDWWAAAAVGELIPYGSTLLQRARDLLADPGDVRLDRAMQTYVEQSIAAADAADAEAQERGLQATEEQERRRQQAEEEQARWLCDAEALAAARRRTVQGAVLGLVAALLLAGLAGWQWRMAGVQRDKGQQALASATDAANSMVFELAQKFRVTQSVPVAVVKDILDRASQLQARLIGLGNPSADLRRSQADAAMEMSNTLLDQGETQGALTAARQAQEIFQSLLTTQPDSTDLQRELSVSDDNVGDVLVAQGNLPEALKSYRDGLAIGERLARADPGNAGWQRDLSVSDNEVGDVLVAQGNLPEALKSYRDGLAIAEHLAHADPGNAGWQRDLSVSYEKVGDVLVAQGNLPEALKSYRDGLAIRERLARVDPGNADWQRDLSVSLGRVAEALLKLDQKAEALSVAERALAQRRSAIARMPDDPRLAGGLPNYEGLLRRAGGTP
jgi:tetratricopeptide (TPR) repeat protein